MSVSRSRYIQTDRHHSTSPWKHFLGFTGISSKQGEEEEEEKIKEDKKEKEPRNEDEEACLLKQPWGYLKIYSTIPIRLF